MGWNLSCPNWESKLRAGKSLIPDLPLFKAEGDRAVAVFNKLRLADVHGSPYLADAAGDWFREIVRAVFGSCDPATQKRAIREFFLLVPKKNWKALALDTPVATPTGFTTMGDVVVGDSVIDADGNATVVVGKSEVFVGRKCFEVEFSTGERVVCDAGHLWVTDAHSDRAGQPMTRAEKKTGARNKKRPTAKTTADIARTLTVASGKYAINNHRTTLCGSLDLPEASLPIHPYVLGAWLGDGATNAAAVSAGRRDADHMVSQFRAVGHSARILGYDKRNGCAEISIAEPGNCAAKLKYRFRTEAVKLGVLGNKHIPTIYLRASATQRMELLRGLMDTDGSADKAGNVTYYTTLPALRDGIIELINSLGFKASCSEYRAKLKDKDCGPVWSIRFCAGDIPVFTLPRKLVRRRAIPRNAPRSRTRQIVAVRPVESVPTQCIAVASETKQFLVTRSLIPTHNTGGGALIMLTALLLNRRPNAPLFFVAPVHETAEMAFSAAAGAIALDTVLSKKLHVRDHLKRIVHRETGAELAIVTFDPSTLTGKKCVAILVDELHVVSKMSKASSAIRQLRGGMIPFDEAFMMFITTQSEEAPSGVFKTELMNARAIRDGTREGFTLPIMYEYPQAMQRDADVWRNPKHWHMVTPNAGRSVTVERLEQEFDAAQSKGEGELREWASQHLNVEIGVALHSDRWAGADFWEARGDKRLTLEELIRRCEVITAGVDFGGLDDWLALSFTGREKETGIWLHWAHAWAHPIAFKRRKSEAERWKDFVADGDLTVVEQVGDEVSAVIAFIMKIEKSGLLERVGVDRYKIQEIFDGLIKAGLAEDRIVAIDQGWKLVGAISTTERRLASGKFLHAGSPMMAYCVGNAKVEQKGNNIIISKQIAGASKIDPLMSLLNAVSLLSLNPASPQKRYEMFFV